MVPRRECFAEAYGMVSSRREVLRRHSASAAGEDPSVSLCVFMEINHLAIARVGVCGHVSGCKRCGHGSAKNTREMRGASRLGKLHCEGKLEEPTVAVVCGMKDLTIPLPSWHVWGWKVESMNDLQNSQLSTDDKTQPKHATEAHWNTRPRRSLVRTNKGFHDKKAESKLDCVKCCTGKAETRFNPLKVFTKNWYRSSVFPPVVLLATRVAWKSYHRVRRQHEVALITVSLTRTARTWRNCSLEVYNPGAQSHVRTWLRLPSILRTWMGLFGLLA